MYLNHNKACERNLQYFNAIRKRASKCSTEDELFCTILKNKRNISNGVLKLLQAVSNSTSTEIIKNHEYFIDRASTDSIEVQTPYGVFMVLSTTENMQLNAAHIMRLRNLTVQNVLNCEINTYLFIKHSYGYLPVLHITGNYQLNEIPELLRKQYINVSNTYVSNYDRTKMNETIYFQFKDFKDGTIFKNALKEDSYHEGLQHCSIEQYKFGNLSYVTEKALSFDALKRVTDMGVNAFFTANMQGTNSDEDNEAFIFNCRLHGLRSEEIMDLCLYTGIVSNHQNSKITYDPLYHDLLLNIGE